MLDKKAMTEEMKALLGPYGDDKLIDGFDLTNTLIAVAAKFAYFERKISQIVADKKMPKKEKMTIIAFINETKRDDLTLLKALPAKNQEFVYAKTNTIVEFLKTNENYLKEYYKLYLGVDAINKKALALYQAAYDSLASDDKYVVFKPHEWLWNQEAMMDSWNIYQMNLRSMSKSARKRAGKDKFGEYMQFMCENYPSTLGKESRKFYESMKIIDIVDLFYIHGNS